MHSVRSPRQEITRLICIEKINDIQVKMSFGHDISNSIFTYDKKSEFTFVKKYSFEFYYLSELSQECIRKIRLPVYQSNYEQVFHRLGQN